MKKTNLLLSISIIALGFSGCATYRSSSGIQVPSTYVKPTILVTGTQLVGKNCKTIAKVDTSIKKLTAFSANPTKNQAFFILAEKGKKIGANAVRNVKWETGVGLTTWGYIDANGDASKCDLK